MQPSMEVRWFLEGKLPGNIEQWFKGGFVPSLNAPMDDETRDDIYFVPYNQPDLGIKLRALKKRPKFDTSGKFDKVEIKLRRSAGRARRLRDGVQGRIEQWVKWSFDLQKNDKGEPVNLPDVFALPGTWIVIKKQRLTRKFAISAPGAVIAVDAVRERPPEGCNLEIAWLEINGKAWWSLCFEAFGKIEAVQKNLQMALGRVLADPKFPKLQAQDSYAYPTWLRRVLATPTPNGTKTVP